MTAAVLRKELATLWASPVPYVVGAAFQAVLGVLYVNQLQVRDQAVIQPLFPLAGFLLVLAVPLLAMRTVADEIRSGTLDVLLAVPVPTLPVVAGKWLASWLTGTVALAPAALFALLLSWWGDPDLGPVIAGFLGLALLVAALAGLGVAASSLTASQPVAAMTAVFTALVLWFSHVGSETFSVGRALAALSLSERLRIFASGGIDSADVVFFAALTTLAVVAAAGAIELRRLR